MLVVIWVYLPVRRRLELVVFAGPILARSLCLLARLVECPSDVPVPCIGWATIGRSPPAGLP